MGERAGQTGWCNHGWLLVGTGCWQGLAPLLLGPLLPSGEHFLLSCWHPGLSSFLPHTIPKCPPLSCTCGQGPHHPQAVLVSPPGASLEV